MRIFIQLLKRAVQGTVLYKPAAILYQLYKEMMVMVNERRIFNEGFYRISLDNDEIRPFHLYLPYSRMWERNNQTRFRYDFTTIPTGATQRIDGEYKKHVTDVLISILDKDDVVWDIGAQFGYHTFTCAQKAKSVYAVEALESNCENIRRSINKNQKSNITVFQGTVGKDFELYDLKKMTEYPDLIIIDIEGYEYKVLENINISAWRSQWLIEVHTNEALSDADLSTNEENDMIDWFESAGYNASRIEDSNHILFHT